MVLTDQNFKLEEVEEEVKFRNACHPLAYNLLPSCLLSRNMKVRIYETVILSVILCGCETWSHIEGKTWTEGGLCPQSNVPTPCPPLSKVYSHYL